MKKTVVKGLAVALLTCAPAGAFAASDYLLTFDDVAGGPITLDSWSWGASNPASTGMGAGREASSGQATGRRVAPPRAIATISGSPDLSVVSTQDRVTGMTFVLPTQRVTASGMCSGGSASHTGRLSGGGEAFQLSNIHVASCTAGGAMTRVVVTGEMKHQKTGHVTLMK